MTDRIRTLTVQLDKDYRDDDAQSILDAIKMIKGVTNVELGDPIDMKDHINRNIVRSEIRVILFEALNKYNG